MGRARAMRTLIKWYLQGWVRAGIAEFERDLHLETPRPVGMLRNPGEDASAPS